MKKFKVNIFLEIILIAIILAYAFFVVFQLDHEVAKVSTLNSAEQTIKNETIIKVMTYNIAHGRGHFSMYEKSAFGRNFNIKSRQEVIDRLDDIVSLVNEEKIDILILEEVDFDTTWSYNVNQATYIAKNAGFVNVVEGLKWSIDLPFFKIRSGNAILSKYPILYAKNKKYWSEGFWKRFIGGHSFLSAVYSINGKPVNVIGTHLDSDSENNREQEAEQLVIETELSKYPVIMSGDLNAVTPLTKQENEKMRDKFGDETLETFINSNLYDIDMDKLNPNEERMFTYSAEDPHRLIDYIFTTKELKLTEYYVVKKELSDHFSLVARIIV
jgi:endonuclease/exonuclease/phosphatase family metal-dependent hydrolase